MANDGCLAALPRFLAALMGTGREPSVDDYYLRDDWMSPAELSFHHVLRSAVGDRLTICLKVSLGDLIYASHPDRGRALGLMNRIDRKHVDFLLCDRDTLRPLAGIELDDASHRQARRQERDRFVESVFRAVGLPLLRARARHAYNVVEVAALVEGVLGAEAPAQAPAEQPASSPSVAPPAQDAHLAPTTTGTDQALESTTDPATHASDAPPACPKCGSPMVLRTARRGPSAGSAFWGCPNYPRCHGVVR